MFIKHELQNIISGNGKVRHGEVIQTTLNYPRGKKEAVSELEKTKFSKNEETEILKFYIDTRSFWCQQLDESKYIGEGAEQKIHEFSDSNFVIKINSSIFYAFWEDYLINLLIHNYFFPHLAYELFGFITINNTVNAVVKQPFVKATKTTNLIYVKEFLKENGFLNKKNNDYFSPRARYYT